MRVCQFRHFGDRYKAAIWGSPVKQSLRLIFLPGCCQLSNRAERADTGDAQIAVLFGDSWILACQEAFKVACMRRLSPVLFAAVSKSFDCPALETYSSSFAFMVILALSTLDTGHPVLAFSAAFWKVAGSALGTRPTTSR
jgi:hypothetical protein